MRRIKKQSATTNSGSMADIAFLLLIFFMVATSLHKEKSIPMKLSPSYDGPAGSAIDSKLLSIDINAKNEILIEGIESNLSNAPELIIQELKIILLKTNKPVIALRLHQDANYTSYMNLLSMVKQAIKKTKEEISIQMYDRPLFELNKQQYKSLNKKISIKISESEYILS